MSEYFFDVFNVYMDNVGNLYKIHAEAADVHKIYGGFLSKHFS